MHSNPNKNHHHRNGGEWQRREAQLGEWGVAGLELAPKTETHYSPIQRSWTPLHNKKKACEIADLSGGGGGRTRVQTRNPRAFYMFSRPFNPPTRARQAAAKPESQPLNLA